jgi:CHASE3 domain sensor protein
MLLLLSLRSFCYTTSNVNAYAQIDTTTKLQAANDAFKQAFNAILSAEKAGANVTILMSQLNLAANYLTQAENAYRYGDLNTGASSADKSLTIAREIAAASQDTEETATVASQNTFLSTTSFTIIGAFAYTLALFLVWRRFKRRYIKSLSEAKPEVSS